MVSILVVDDSQANAELIKIALEMKGFQVNCAYSGDEGLSLVRAVQPALVIIDLRMPGSTIDGWELIERLRNSPDFAELPITLLIILLLLLVGEISFS